jgi:hypothetical protein
MFKNAIGSALMPPDFVTVQTTAAFTLPILVDPANPRALRVFRPPPGRRGYVYGSGTPVLDDASENPLESYLAEAAAKHELQYKIERQIEDRLRELRVEAQIDGESVSEKSVSDLRQFAQSVGATKRPSIFLLDTGNIRALWRGSDGQQVGLQFLGDGRVQFVIFSWRTRPRMMMRVAGIDSLIETRARITRDHVEHLLVG